MADHTQDKTDGVVQGVKSAVKGIKGTGDAIRGTVNESIDTAFNDPEGKVKNRLVKEKGEREMKEADQKLAAATKNRTNTPQGTTSTGTTGTTGTTTA